MSITKDSTMVTVTTVATINNTKIVVIENGEKRVAVKPICEALGIDFSTQLQKLKSDPILSSTMGLSPTVGADQKEREMVTIPFKFVFGWLFRIDSRNVKPEARDVVMQYQLECYNALYEHFTELDEYMRYRQLASEKVWEDVETARENFKTAKTLLEEKKKEFSEIRALTLEVYRLQRAQLQLDFTDKTEA